MSTIRYLRLDQLNAPAFAYLPDDMIVILAKKDGETFYHKFVKIRNDQLGRDATKMLINSYVTELLLKL